MSLTRNRSFIFGKRSNEYSRESIDSISNVFLLCNEVAVPSMVIIIVEDADDDDVLVSLEPMTFETSSSIRFKSNSTF